MTNKEYIAAIVPLIQKYAPQYDIKSVAAVTAQAILESGWGRSKLAAKYHNYFGLKCGTLWKGPSVNMDTMEEYKPGVQTKIKDNFRVYANMEEGVKGYFEFIQLKRYQNLKGIADAETYLTTIIKDGYATGFGYVTNAMALVEQYKLTQYDLPEASGDSGAVEKAIAWMEKTAKDPAHGYDQAYRWGERGDYDCSSAVITAWQQAGVPVKTAGATYTGNMLQAFKQCGFDDVTAKVNRGTGEGMKRGDVLLNVVHHTAMYCGNGQEVEASINERGGAVGGAPGDQTGREFLIRPYRNYPWNYVLRYNGADVPATAPEKPGTLCKEPQWVGKVTASKLNVRTWAGTEFGNIKSYPILNRGNLVDVCDTIMASDGIPWYYVRIAGKYYGFVCGIYIKRQ